MSKKKQLHIRVGSIDNITNGTLNARSVKQLSIKNESDRLQQQQTYKKKYFSHFNQRQLYGTKNKRKASQWSFIKTLNMYQSCPKRVLRGRVSTISAPAKLLSPKKRFMDLYAIMLLHLHNVSSKFGERKSIKSSNLKLLGSPIFRSYVLKTYILSLSIERSVLSDRTLKYRCYQNNKINARPAGIRYNKNLIKSKRRRKHFFNKYNRPILLRRDVESFNRYVFSKNRRLKRISKSKKFKCKRDYNFYSNIRSQLKLGKTPEIMSLSRLKIWFSDKNSKRDTLSSQAYLNTARTYVTRQLLRFEREQPKSLERFNLKNRLLWLVHYLNFVQSFVNVGDDQSASFLQKQQNFIGQSKFTINIKRFDNTASRPYRWYKMLRIKFAKSKKYRKRRLIQMKYWLKNSRDPLTNLPINVNCKLQRHLKWFTAPYNKKHFRKFNAGVKSLPASSTKVKNTLALFSKSNAAKKELNYKQYSRNLNFNLRTFKNVYKQYLFRVDEFTFNKDEKLGKFDRTWWALSKNFGLRTRAKQSTPWMEQLIFGKRLYKANFFKLYNREKPIFATRRTKVYKLYNNILHNKRSRVKYKVMKSGGVRSFSLQRVLTKVVLPFFGKLKRKQLKLFWNQVKHQKSRNTLRSNNFLFSLSYRLDNFLHNINWAPNAFWARKIIRKGWIYVLSPVSDLNYKNRLSKNELFPLKALQKSPICTVGLNNPIELPPTNYTNQEWNYKRRLNPGDIVYINPKIKLHNLLFFTKRIQWNRQPSLPTVELNTNQTIARITRGTNLTPVKYSRNQRANKFNLRLTIN